MIFRVFQAMPLLTELVSVKDGFNYRHGAPDGALACFKQGLLYETFSPKSPASF
jgi:hypothetical protein